jgi:septum formation protein
VLEQYIASGLWRGKAGAYGIQDNSDPLVELISGDMTTVMGLPMPPLIELLNNVGVVMR